MKTLRSVVIAGILASLSSVGSVALASEQDNREEAQSVCEMITATQKAYGKEKTLAKANNPNGDFQKTGVYVFAYDASALTLAHPDPDQVGKSLADMQGVNGRAIKQEIVHIGDSKDGTGWIRYDWPNAVSKSLNTMVSYIEKFEDVYWVCGYYK